MSRENNPLEDVKTVNDLIKFKSNLKNNQIKTKIPSDILSESDAYKAQMVNLIEYIEEKRIQMSKIKDDEKQDEIENKINLITGLANDFKESVNNFYNLTFEKYQDNSSNMIEIIKSLKDAKLGYQKEISQIFHGIDVESKNLNELTANAISDENIFIFDELQETLDYYDNKIKEYSSNFISYFNNKSEEATSSLDKEKLLNVLSKLDYFYTNIYLVLHNSIIEEYEDLKKGLKLLQKSTITNTVFKFQPNNQGNSYDYFMETKDILDSQLEKLKELPKEFNSFINNLLNEDNLPKEE